MVFRATPVVGEENAKDITRAGIVGKGRTAMQDITNLLKNQVFEIVVGSDFVPSYPLIDNVAYNPGFSNNGALNITCYAGVSLPNGVTLTRITVFIEGGNRAFTLNRRPWAGGAPETMASGNANTGVTTITSGLIDNGKYLYYVQTTIEPEDLIDGARIDYQA